MCKWKPLAHSENPRLAGGEIPPLLRTCEPEMQGEEGDTKRAPNNANTLGPDCLMRTDRYIPATFPQKCNSNPDSVPQKDQHENNDNFHDAK